MSLAYRIEIRVLKPRDALPKCRVFTYFGVTTSQIREFRFCALVIYLFYYKVLDTTDRESIEML